MISEITSYLQPPPLQYDQEHFTNWAGIFTEQSAIIKGHAREVQNLAQSCRRLRTAISSYKGHIHVDEFDCELIESVLRLPGVHSLSTNDFNEMDMEITRINRRLSAAQPSLDVAVQNPYLNAMGPTNKSIRMLQLLNNKTSAQTLSWLLRKLKGLEEFFIVLVEPKFRLLRPNLTINKVVSLLSEHTHKLKKLVFTFKEDMGYKNWLHFAGINHFSSLHLLRTLTSLKIGSFLLLWGGPGAVDGFNDKKEVHSLLPRSLVELDVYYDYGVEWPFISNRVAPSARPEWLFNNYSPTRPNTRLRSSSRECGLRAMKSCLTKRINLI